MLDPETIRDTRAKSSADRGDIVEIGTKYNAGDSVGLVYLSIQGKTGRLPYVMPGKAGVLYGKYKVPVTPLSRHLVRVNGADVPFEKFMFDNKIPCQHLTEVTNVEDTTEKGVKEVRECTTHVFKLLEKKDAIVRFQGIKDAEGNPCGPLAQTLGTKLREEIWTVVGGVAKLKDETKRTVSHAEKAWEPSSVRVDYKTIIWDGDSYLKDLGKHVEKSEIEEVDEEVDEDEVVEEKPKAKKGK